MKRISPQQKSIETGQKHERGLSKSEKIKLGALTLATAAVATGLALDAREAAPADHGEIAVEYTEDEIDQAREILSQVPDIRGIDPEVEHILLQKDTNIHHTRPSAGLDNLEEQLTSDTIVETPGGVGEVTGDNPANGSYTVYVDLSKGEALFVQNANILDK